MKIIPTTRNPDADVISRLEQCLEMAKAGDLVHFVLVGCCPDGDKVQAYAGHSTNDYSTVGQLFCAAMDAKQRNIGDGT